MSLFNVKRGRRQTGRWVPRLETLGERCLPSVSQSLVGGVLTLNSDGAADTIDIRDNGTAAGISVSKNGGPWTAFADVITKIQVNGNGGADTVRYRLTDNLRSYVQRTVWAELDGGNDNFYAYLYDTDGIGSDLLWGSSLKLVATGDDGADWVRVYADQDNDVAPTASLLVDIHGNDDSYDLVTFNYRGEMDGNLFLFAGGGSGNDTVSAYLNFELGSTGYLAGTSSKGVGSLSDPARVRGHDGDDTLTFIVRNNGVAHVFARIEGGDGFDYGTRTANVTPDGVNVDNVVV